MARDDRESISGKCARGVLKLKAVEPFPSQATLRSHGCVCGRVHIPAFVDSVSETSALLLATGTTALAYAEMRGSIEADLDAVKRSLYMLSSACSPHEATHEQCLSTCHASLLVDEFSLPATRMPAAGDTPAWTTLDNWGPRADGEGPPVDNEGAGAATDVEAELRSTGKLSRLLLHSNPWTTWMFAERLLDVCGKDLRVYPCSCHCFTWQYPASLTYRATGERRHEEENVLLAACEERLCHRHPMSLDALDPFSTTLCHP